MAPSQSKRRVPADVIEKLEIFSSFRFKQTKIKFLVILTQTIGHQSDDILVNEVGTQTARPKTSLSFGTIPHKRKSELDSQRVYGSVDSNILRNGQNLQAQVQDIKTLEEQLWKKRDTIRSDDDIAREPNKESVDDTGEVEYSDDSLSDNGKTDFGCRSRQYSNDSCDTVANDGQENFLNAPTLTSWTGFDSNDDDDYDLPELPKRTVSEGYAPWQNFKNILIGNR